MKKLLTLINKRCVIITGLIIAFISLFYTKAFDFGFVFLGLAREGEFLGLVLRLVDFVLAFWLVYISTTTAQRWIESKRWQNISKQTICTLVVFATLAAYWVIYNYNTWYSFKGGVLGYSSLIFCLTLLYKYKPNWLFILVPYFCFDHIILSSSLASLMLVLLGYMAKYTYNFENSNLPLNSTNVEVCRPEHGEGSKQVRTKNIHLLLISSILTLTIITNLLLAIYQVYSGHSLGLYALGESKLELNGIIGIAKQVLPNSDQILLRGYGLMPHPNVLGFLAVFGVILGLEFKKFVLYFQKTKQSYFKTIADILISSSFLLGLISMSRMAIISLVVVAIVYFIPLKLIQRIWQNVILSLVTLTIFVAILTFVSFDFKADSDNYRLQQYQTMVSLIKHEPQALLFGTGIGQYSEHLKNANITTESWENEPFYHPLGNIILEFGLVGIVLVIVLNKQFQECN